MTEFTIAAADLRVGLTTALAFVGTDDALPILCGIHFNAADGAVDLTACDRYVASLETVKVAGEPFPFVLPSSEAKRLLTLMPRGSRTKPTNGMVTFSTRENDRVNATFIGDIDLSLTFTPAEVGRATFPNVRKLLTEQGTSAEPEAIPAIHFNAVYLARIMRTLSGRGQEPVRMSFTTPQKPLVIRHGETFTAMVMPVRHEEARQAQAA